MTEDKTIVPEESGAEIKKEVVKEAKKGTDEGVITNLSDENQQAKKVNYELSLEAMLKAGVHFGHKKAYWNPKMAEYIFGVRNNVHIIDLEKSLYLFKKALKFIDEIVEKNGMILVVGTKNQAKKLVKDVAEEINMPYVNDRWLGGTFTNFNFIKNRIRFLVNNTDALKKGRLNNLTKLERNKLQKKLNRIDSRMGGLIKMTRLPDAVIVLDVNKDIDTVREAKKVGVKIIGLLDSNSNPDVVDYGIPANDDAISSLKYILNIISGHIAKK
jgi:small subunit ribosomal protein S2